MTVNDPREKNQWFETSSISKYIFDYSEHLNKAVKSVSSSELQKFFELLQLTRNMNGHVWVIGNGGSASIADHLCCDFSKGTHHTGQKPISSLALSSGSALGSAISNDFGHEQVFSYQLELQARQGDVLIAISSSGNSQNILRAVEISKNLNIKTVGFSGFDGGKLKNICDISLHVPFSNYGIVEDAHQMIIHAVSQFIYLKDSK